ncbi:hypothetical protein EV121DRAFT_295058 [Schizophyllum commune]
MVLFGGFSVVPPRLPLARAVPAPRAALQAAVLDSRAYRAAHICAVPARLALLGGARAQLPRRSALGGDKLEHRYQKQEVHDEQPERDLAANAVRSVARSRRGFQGIFTKYHSGWGAYAPDGNQQQQRQAHLAPWQHITAVEGIVPTLQNIVATVKFDCSLEFQTVAVHARNAEYSPKRFVAVIMLYAILLEGGIYQG